MTTILTTITQLLDSHHIQYVHKHHPPTPTSEDCARERGEKIEIEGKALVLCGDGIFFCADYYAVMTPRNSRHNYDTRVFALLPKKSFETGPDSCLGLSLRLVDHYLSMIATLIRPSSAMRRSHSMLDRLPTLSFSRHKIDSRSLLIA